MITTWPRQRKRYYKCIKISLKNIVKHDFVIDKLLQASNMSNKIVIHTLQLMKLYLIYLYDNGKKLPIINKQFITSVMKDFYDIYYKDIQGETLDYRYMKTTLNNILLNTLKDL